LAELGSAIRRAFIDHVLGHPAVDANLLRSSDATAPGQFD